MAILTGILQRSLSRLELVIAAIVIFIVAGIFLQKIMLMAARAERQFLENSVINLNTSLHHQAAMMYLKGQRNQLPAMEGMNPFYFSQTASEYYINNDQTSTVNYLDGTQYRILPSKYGGELDYPDEDSTQPGYWYYNREKRELIYRISNDEFFSAEGSSFAHMRYRVTINYEDSNENNQYDPASDVYLGIELKRIGSYQWSI